MKITKKQKTEGVDFDDIDPGDCFIWRTELYIKMDSHNREALLLSSGEVQDFESDADGDDIIGQIFPVNAEIIYEED